jgi:hypothetical protein
MRRDPPVQRHLRDGRDSENQRDEKRTRHRLNLVANATSVIVCSPLRHRIGKGVSEVRSQRESDFLARGNDR